MFEVHKENLFLMEPLRTHLKPKKRPKLVIAFSWRSQDKKFEKHWLNPKTFSVCDKLIIHFF